MFRWSHILIKPYTDLRKKWFWKGSSYVDEKLFENVRKQRDIKLVPTEKRRNYLVSESNFHTTKFFT